MRFWNNLTLKWKFIVICLLLVLIPLSTIFVSVSRILEQGFTQEHQRDAEKIAGFVKNLTIGFEQDLQQTITILRQNETFGTTVYFADSSGETGELQQMSDTLLEKFSLDFLEVRNAKGERLVQAKRAESVAIFETDGAVIQTALQGNQMLSHIVAKEKNMGFRVVAPLYQQQQIIGLIIAGSMIHDAFAQQIANIVGDEIAILRDNVLIAASTPAFADACQRLVYGGPTANNAGMRILATVKIAEKNRIILAMPFQDSQGQSVGAMFLGLETTGLDSIQTSSERTIAEVVGVLVLVVIAVMYGMASFIIRPIAQMTEVAKAIARGDTSHNVPVMSSQDEIGMMAAALQNMKESIQQVLQEVAHLIQSIQEGQLNTRGQPDQFAGSWRELVLGVNSVIEAFTRPFTVIADTVAHISQGIIPENLTAETKGDFHAMKTGLNTMMTNLNNVVINVKTAANQAASSSQELHANAAQMANGVADQAASAEEVSAAMEQMAASIHQNAHNAKETEKIALQAVHEAKKSGEAVAKTVSAMHQIAKTTSIIQEISSQTHLLSLNASIEAAKAQDYGRGFAVVSAEVRALAERSRIAAEKITDLVSASLEVSKNAETALNDLVPNIEKTAALVQEISAASDEQNNGAEQINLAIQQLDQVIQQNSSTADEIASTAETLATQSEQMQHLMRFFRLHRDGQAEAASEEPEKPAVTKRVTQKTSMKPWDSQADKRRRFHKKEQMNFDDPPKTDHQDDDFEQF